MPGIEPVAGSPAATPSAAMGGLGKDAFLQLLVAQLRYQNPMSPVDGQQYLQQAAQFTMVEKLEQIAQGQAEVTAWQRAVVAEGMVGRAVTGMDLSGADVEGVVTAVKLTPSGPLLVLDDGGELPVDYVDVVREPKEGAPGS